MFIHVWFNHFRWVNTTRASKEPEYIAIFFPVCVDQGHTATRAKGREWLMFKTATGWICLNFYSLCFIWLFLWPHFSVTIQKEEMPSWCQSKPITPTLQKKEKKAQSNMHINKSNLTYWHLDIMKTFNCLLYQLQKSREKNVPRCLCFDLCAGWEQKCCNVPKGVRIHTITTWSVLPILTLTL